MARARALYLPYRTKLRLLLHEKCLKWEMHEMVPDERPFADL
jgi:hypothetical protein